MANLTLTGYLAALQSVAWSAGQALDSLADDEYTDLADEADNSSAKYLRCDVELVLASAAFTGADSAVELFLVPSIDGTNYPTWGGNVTTTQPANSRHYVGSLFTTGTTAAQRLILRGVYLPPGKFRWALRSRANVALAGSGNSLGWRPHSLAA